MINSNVVIILPYNRNKILMQLRDTNKGVVFGGHWGFFGGSIENGELPLDAAKRELYEEIGSKTSVIHRLDKCELSSLGILYSHSFYCSLNDVSLSNLTLNEGLDFGLFTLNNIRKKKLYSNKLKKYFPVIDHPHIVNSIEKLFTVLI